MYQHIPIDQIDRLPKWRQPKTLLYLMAIAMPLTFAVWSALLNNFVVEVASFDGSDIGWLHTVREIPGFLAVGVIALIIFIREQVLGLVSLALLGAASAITAWFPSFTGLLTITMLSSIGFHYYETVNQSLQLQWLKKEESAACVDATMSRRPSYHQFRLRPKWSPVAGMNCHAPEALAGDLAKGS